MSQKKIVDSYDELYKKGGFRESWEGKISLKYKVPKYASLFINHFKNYKNLSVLELGAGDGSITKQIFKKLKYKRYVATDISDMGVRRLRKLGIQALKMDAEKLKFKDNSFDVVCCFDVMHHVKNPRKMALEMIRVSKKNIFLIEANGLCLIRKFLEKTAKYKKVGEKSYTPKRYASFFASNKIKKITIKPFLSIFPFTPSILVQPSIWLSELMEHIPLLRWQCSSLLIYVEKKKKFK